MVKFNKAIIGSVIVVFVAIALVSFFNMGGFTGYSVSELRQVKSDEFMNITWPTSERPINSNQYIYFVQKGKQNADLGVINSTPGIFILDFSDFRSVFSEVNVLVGSYMIIKRDNKKINMGFTMMDGSRMFTGLKETGPGAYTIEYLAKLSNGVEQQGTISFIVS